MVRETEQEETKQQRIKEKVDKYKEKNKERAKKIGTPKITVEPTEEEKQAQGKTVVTVLPKNGVDTNAITPSKEAKEEGKQTNKQKEFVLSPVTPLGVCPLEGPTVVIDTPPPSTLLVNGDEEEVKTPKKKSNSLLIYDEASENRLITPIKKPQPIQHKEEKEEEEEEESTPSLWSIYTKLWKMRLSVLVVFTGYGTYVCTKKVAAGNWKTIAKESTVLCLGIFGQAACANTLNELWEVKRDAIMQRTRGRPLPQKQISKTHALLQGLAMGAGGTYLLAAHGNKEAAAWGLLNIGLYAFVYTPMKPLHWLNTWVGTINGAIPPLMGAVLATRTSLLTSEWGQLAVNQTGWFMAGLMYFWQIPHFMAISYKCGKEYDKAGYQMLPIQQPKHAALQAIGHSAMLFPLCWSFAVVGAQHATSPWGTTIWSAFAGLTTYTNYKWALAPSIVFYKDLKQHEADAPFLLKEEEVERKHQHYNNATNLFWGSLKYLPVVFGAAMLAFTLTTPPKKHVTL